MDGKRYWLENLFDYDGIAKLISILPKTLGSNANVSFEYDGKEYNIEKTDKKIKISCNDGRLFGVSASTSEVNGEYGGWYYLTGVRTAYKLFDATLEAYKGIENKELTDLEDYDTYKRGSFNYCHLCVLVGHYLHFLYDFYANRVDGFEFTDQGIEYHDYLITNDCERVISKNGIDLPSKEQIEISLKKKKKNYKKSVKGSDFDSCVKEVLDLYNDKLPSLKPAIKLHHALVDGSIQNYLFSKEEFAMFYKKLAVALRKVITEYNDKEILDETKKLIKSLSSSGRTTLRRYLDENKK